MTYEKVRCRFVHGYWFPWWHGQCRRKTTHPSGYCWRHRLGEMATGIPDPPYELLERSQARLDELRPVKYRQDVECGGGHRIVHNLGTRDVVVNIYDAHHRTVLPLLIQYQGTHVVEVVLRADEVFPCTLVVTG